MTLSLVSSPLFSSDQQSDSKPAPSMDNSKATFLYWFLGFCPLVGRSLSPVIVFIMNHVLKTKHDNPTLLYNKLVAETSRQFTKGALGVISYFGLAELVQTVINHRNKAKGKDDPNAAANANFWKTITGQISTTLISLMAGGLFVPMEKFLEREDKSAKKSIITPDFQAKLIDFAKKHSAPMDELNALVSPVVKITAPKVPNKSKEAVHKFLDKILTKNGEPIIPRAAAFSTFSLVTSLTALGFGVYLLTKAFGSDSSAAKARAAAKVSPKVKSPKQLPISHMDPIVASSVYNLDNQGPNMPPTAPTAMAQMSPNNKKQNQGNMQPYFSSAPPLARMI
jgi:hypothetical protein